MLLKYFALLILLLFNTIAFSQNSGDIRLTPDDLPGMEEKRYSIYDENTLWGYINGGADIYLEYGLQVVLVQDLIWQGETFKVDGYFMNSNDAAFGIFSVSRFNCKNSQTISSWSCITNQQVQVAIGNLYLSVISYSGSERGAQMAMEIAQKIVAKSDTTIYALPNPVTLEDIVPNFQKIKLICGQLAMQNALPNLEEVFSSVENYKLWVVPFDQDGNSYNMMLVWFSSANDLEAVKKRYLEKNEKTRQVIHQSGNRLMVIKSKDGDIGDDLFRELISDFEKNKSEEM